MPSIHTKEFPWGAESDLARRDNVIETCKQMMNAAQTAPVTGGVDHLEQELIWGKKELDAIAEKMDELSHLPEHKRIDEMFRIEAQMVRESDCVLALGSFRDRNMPFDADCGMCSGPAGCSFIHMRRNSISGHIDHSDKSQATTPIDGPLCTMFSHNLGYGVGSALWTAKTLMVDARPFMTVGMAAQKLGYCRHSAMVVGICVSATAKNPLVDVSYNHHVLNMRRAVESMHQGAVIPRQFGLDYRLVSRKQSEKNKK